MTHSQQDFEQSLIEIRQLFLDYGHKTYGEACTQIEHGISCAEHGVHLHMPEPIVLAAFLHDIGHFIADRQQLAGFDQWGYAKHDELGAAYLKQQGFPESIYQPIHLHVAAKRYLAKQTAVDLSAASAATLAQQGGEMNAQEAQNFEQHPWQQQALQLRQLDDLGKPSHTITVDLDYWLERLRIFLSESR